MNEQQLIYLTGKPVSEKLKNILRHLENKEYICADEIENTDELKTARRQIDSSSPTINRNGRLERQMEVFNDMMNLGSSTIDEEGKRNYNGEVRQDLRLDIVIGLPGSGKSSALVDVISQEFHARVIDNDMAKEMLPEFNHGLGAGIVHRESQLISNAVFSKAISNHENIVLPKVGSNAQKLLDQYIDYAKEQAYEVNIHFVDLDRNKALGRMITRFIDEGRFLDPKLINKYAPTNTENKILQSYETLKHNEHIHGFSKWNNDVEKGQKPILIEYNNLTGDYISNARKENAADRKGERSNERGKDRFTENITSDLRIAGGDRGDKPQSYVMGEKPQGRNKQSPPGKTVEDKECSVSDNTITGRTEQNERRRPDSPLQQHEHVEKEKSILGKPDTPKSRLEQARENPLNKVEELIEGNYNQIDGIINNLPPKHEHSPTFNTCLAQAKERSEKLRKPKYQSITEKEKNNGIYQ